MEQGTVIKDEGLFAYYGWPTVARLKDGTIVVVASGMRMRHVCPFGRVVAIYSRDEGRTWSAPSIMIDTPLDDRDAGICVLSDGRVIITTFNNDRKVQRKYLDMWYRLPALEKENLFIEQYLDCINDGIEKQWLGSHYMISCDGYQRGKIFKSPFCLSTPHGPFLLNDGSIMYVGEQRFYDNDEKPGRLIAAVSLDGINWEQKGEIRIVDSDLRFCECHGLQLPDGRILVHIRANNGSELSIWQCQSIDGGIIFSDPVMIIEDGAPAHLIRHSSGTIICSYACRTLPHAGPRVAVSNDGGESWRTSILRQDAVNSDIGYSSSVELRDGSILTVFYYIDDINRDCTSIDYVRWSLGEL